jgi:UDP-4-amino-4,6-dideoxy-N-acetyl-beta-L-altrosamine transaminase
MVEAFEEEVNSYVGSEYSVAANSATSALHLACLALGVGPGDKVWTSAVTFVASANCAVYCGAEIDFVDIHEATYNMSVSALREKLEAAKKNGTLPKVVIPVHLTGQSCEMAGIWELAQEYGFRVIEDASHAIGGKYKGTRIGSCAFSDITVFSFHPVKIITTGEGGMATTNDSHLAKSMRLLRTHGITRESADMISPDGSSWYYEQIDLGYNYRMTDMQAALGISQLKRIDCFLEKRHKLAAEYRKSLEGHNVTQPAQHLDAWSSYHLFVIRLQAHLRSRVMRALNDQGVRANLHYIPVYKHPYYARLGFKPSNFPASERYFAEAISLPMFPELKKGEIRRVVKIVKTALS